MFYAEHKMASSPIITANKKHYFRNWNAGTTKKVIQNKSTILYVEIGFASS